MSTLGRLAGAIARRFRVPPAEAAWQHAVRDARAAPRHVAGRRRMMGWDLEYPDLLTFAAQWHDLVVADALAWVPPREEATILDCGANVGLSVLLCRQRAPRARITAYEADPTLAAMLRRNLERNGAGDCRCEAAAVWTSAGTVRFAEEGADGGALADVPGAPVARAIEVPSVRLRDVLAGHGRVDLLKLDVEGAEGMILEDCAGAMAEVQAVALEVHEFAGTRRAPAVLARLSAEGFTWAIDAVTPIDPREPAVARRAPFPGLSTSFILRVKAWRA